MLRAGVGSALPQSRGAAVHPQPGVFIQAVCPLLRTAAQGLCLEEQKVQTRARNGDLLPLRRAQELNRPPSPAGALITHLKPKMGTSSSSSSLRELRGQEARTGAQASFHRRGALPKFWRTQCRSLVASGSLGVRKKELEVEAFSG